MDCISHKKYQIFAANDFESEIGFGLRLCQKRSRDVKLNSTYLVISYHVRFSLYPGIGGCVLFDELGQAVGSPKSLESSFAKCTAILCSQGTSG